VARSQGRWFLVVAAPVFLAAGGIGLVGAIALSADSGPAPATGIPSDWPTPSSAASMASPAAEATPSTSQSRTSKPRLPSPPAKTSGGLTARTLPSARSLGTGWAFRVDQGSAEGGYVGNGTPTLARDPHEVVMTVVPLGCEQRSDLPTPTHVLETDYRQRAHAVAGVGLRLRFASTTAAGRFVAMRRVDLAACAKQPMEAADFGLRLVSGLRDAGQGTYVSVRTDPTLPKAERTWTELAGWLGGRDVVLLAVNASSGSAVVDVGRLGSAVRAVLR
jgi:hypothetical protein